jgi:threonine/homoserine/homoserine lactone efflux protein
MTGHVFAFLGISLAIIVTPGQDTALTIRNALLGGRRSGVFTALGVAAGQALWALAAAAGVAALLQASEPAFVALKLAGAAYLILLGVQALSQALRRRSREAVGGRRPSGGVVPVVAFRQGVVSNLGNPKMAVFVTSLLPPFAGGGSFLVLLARGAAFCLLTLTWLTAYAVTVAKAGDFLRRRRIRRLLDALTGAVLVALGLRLVAEER